MRSIQEYVSEGIHSQSDLEGALLCAMRLVFSTIPPYLCAQWSITDGDTDGDVDSMFDMIVVQEMYHFALAGNMLSALGVVPAIDNDAFLISNPAHELPGGIKMLIPVDLQPLSREQVAVFMQIEQPQFPPVPALADVEGPATIGDFYDEIETAYKVMSKTLVFDQSAKFVTGFGTETFAIKSADDAVRAIEQIKAEGEGTAQRPTQMQGSADLAHFYRFQELYDGKRRADDPVNPNQPIAFPKAKPFARSTKSPSESLQFSQAFTKFMIGLKRAWSDGVRPSVNDMRSLQTLGESLILGSGIQPEFVWASA
jgi:hypothetical protein